LETNTAAGSLTDRMSQPECEDDRSARRRRRPDDSHQPPVLLPKRRSTVITAEEYPVPIRLPGGSASVSEGPSCGNQGTCSEARQSAASRRGT
jgi:hypothetical protein